MENNIKKMLEHNIIKLEMEKKLNKLKIWSLIFELLISVSGWVMLTILLDWKICLAVMLIMWGNNMGVSRQISDSIKTFTDIISRFK